MVDSIPQFDFYLRFAKPLVLNLPEPNDRVLAAAWIQKLRDENVGSEELRTDYLKLLLFVLQRRRLAGPFAENPNQYDKLEEFPAAYRLQDVARAMIEADDSERKERIRKGLAGPSGDYPPYTIEYSADLLEYAAAQDIPNFGVQAYYAMSKEPIPKWDKAEKGIFPKSLISAMEKRDGDETLAGPASSATLAARRSRSRERPPRSRSQSRMPKSGSKTRFRSKSEEPRQPSRVAEPPAPVKPPPDDRKPPTWGSNLIDVTEPPIRDDIYETVPKFDEIPYRELLGSPPQSAHSIPSGAAPCSPPPVTQIYSPKLPMGVTRPVYFEEEPSLLDATFQSEQDFKEFDKMLVEFEQQQRDGTPTQKQRDDICTCTPPPPDLRPMPTSPSPPSLQLELPPMPQFPSVQEQEEPPSITTITETKSTLISPSKTKTTKKTVTVKEQGTQPSRSISRIPVISTSTSKIPTRSTSSIRITKKSSKKVTETIVGAEAPVDESHKLQTSISKDLESLEKKMEAIEAEHAADMERYGKLPPRPAPLPTYRSPTPPPEPFSPLQGETLPFFQSPPPMQSPMTPPPSSVCPGAYGTPSPYRATMTPPLPYSRPTTPPSVYREPMTPPPLPSAAPRHMPSPPSRAPPCSPCSDDEFLEYERMFKGDTPPRVPYSPQSYMVGKTPGEEAARRQYASLLPQPPRERKIRRPIRRRTPSPERRDEEDSEEEFERYERLFQAGEQATTRPLPQQPFVAPAPSIDVYAIAREQYEELVAAAPPSPRSREIMEAARRRIEDLQHLLQPDVGVDMERTPPPFSDYPEIREAAVPIIYRPEEFGLTGLERWQHAPQFFEGLQGFSPYQEPREAMRSVFPRFDTSVDALDSEFEPELAVEELDEAAEASTSKRELEQSIREVVTDFAGLQQVTPALADVPVTTPRRSPSPRRSTPFDVQMYSPLHKETPPELPDDLDDLCECIDNYGLPVPVSEAPHRPSPFQQRVSESPQRALTSPQRPLTPPQPPTSPHRVPTPPRRFPTPPRRSPTPPPPPPPQRVATPPQRIATPPQKTGPWTFQTPPSPQPTVTRKSPQFVAPPGPQLDHEMPPIEITQFSPTVCYSPPASPTTPPSPFDDGRTPPPRTTGPRSPSSIRQLYSGLPNVEDVCGGPCSSPGLTDVTPPDFLEDQVLFPSPQRPRTPPRTQISPPQRTPPRLSPAPQRVSPPLSAPHREHIKTVVAPERQELIERVSRLVADAEDVQPPSPFEAPPRSPQSPCRAIAPTDQRHMMMETPPRDILHDVELQLSPEDAPPMATTTTTTTIEEEIVEELPSQFDFQDGFRPESPRVCLPFKAMRAPTVFDRPCLEDVTGEIPPDEFDAIPDSPLYSPGPDLETFKKEIRSKAPTRRLRKVVRSKEVLSHRLPPPIFEEEHRDRKGRPRRIDFDQPEDGPPYEPPTSPQRPDYFGEPVFSPLTPMGPSPETRPTRRPRRLDFGESGEVPPSLTRGQWFTEPLPQLRSPKRAGMQKVPRRIDFGEAPEGAPCRPREQWFAEERLPPTRTPKRAGKQKVPRRLDFGEVEEAAPSRSRREWFAQEPLPQTRTPKRAKPQQRVSRRIDFDQGEEGPCAGPCAGPPPPREEWQGDFYPLPSEHDTRTPLTRSPSRQARKALLSPRLVVKKGEPCQRKMTARRYIDFDRPEVGAYVTPPRPERAEWTGEFQPIPGRITTPELPPQPLPEDLFGVAAPTDFYYVPSELDTSLPPGLPSPIRPPTVVPGWQTPPHLKPPSPPRPPPFQFRMPKEMRDIIDVEARPEDFDETFASSQASDDYFPLPTELPYFTEEEIEALPDEVQRRSPTPPPCQPCGSRSPPRPVVSTPAQTRREQLTPQLSTSREVQHRTQTPPCQPCGSRSLGGDEFLQYEREFGVPTPRRASPPRAAVPTSAERKARQQYEQLLSPDYIEETTSRTPPCQPCGSRSPTDDEFLQYEKEFGVPTPKRASPPRDAVPTSAQKKALQQYEELLSPDYVEEETTSRTVIQKTPTGVKKTTTKIKKMTPPRTPPRRSATPPLPQHPQQTPPRRPLTPPATPPSRGGIPQEWREAGPDLRREDLPPDMGEVLPPRDMSPGANEFVEGVERHFYTPHKFDPFKAYMQKNLMVGKTKGKRIRIPAESVRKRKRSLTTIKETHKEEFEDVILPPSERFDLPEVVGFDEEQFNRRIQYGDDIQQHVPSPSMEDRLNMWQMPLDQRMDIRVGDVTSPQMSPRRPLIERAPLEFTVPEEHELPVFPSTAPRGIFEDDMELPGSPRTPPPGSPPCPCRTPSPRTPPPRTPPPGSPPLRSPPPRSPSPRMPAPCGSPGVPCMPRSPGTPIGAESPPFARTPSPVPAQIPQHYDESPSPSSFRRRVQEHSYVEPPNRRRRMHLSPLVSPVMEDDYYFKQTPSTRAIPEAEFVRITPPDAEARLQEQIYNIQALADAQYASLMDSPAEQYEDDFAYPEQINIMDSRHPEQFNLGPGLADPSLGWESPPIAPTRRSPCLPRVEFADQVSAVTPPSLYGSPGEERVEIIEEEETMDYRSISDYLEDLDQVPELQYNDVLSARAPHEESEFDYLEGMSPPQSFESPPPCQPCSSPIDSPNFMRRIQQHEFTEGFLEGARPVRRPTGRSTARMLRTLEHDRHDLEEITERDETQRQVRTPPNLHPMLYANEPPPSGQNVMYESPELPCPGRFLSPKTRIEPYIPGTPKRDRSDLKRRRISFDEPPQEMSPDLRLPPSPPRTPQPCSEESPCRRSPRTPPVEERHHQQTIIETVTEEEEEIIEDGRPPWASPSQYPFPYEIAPPFGGRSSPGIDAINTSFMEEDEEDFRWMG